MPTLEEYLTQISDTFVRKDRITVLGELFKETHPTASPVNFTTMYKRIAVLLKANYGDYYELAKTIYETKHLNGDGNHWNYITAVMKRKRMGNHRE
jgi:hypothetical protein